jgi:hypothetical protein
MMGRFLCRYVEKHYNIRLNRKSFILGNVLPDYCPSFITRPHYLKNNIGHVQNVLRHLVPQNAAWNDKKYSRLLGVLCHFYADFFCYAHREHTMKNLRAHIEYEKSLHCYFIQKLRQISAVRFVVQLPETAQADGVYAQFEKLHAAYLLSSPSCGNDLLYAMTACVEALVWAASARAQANLFRPGGMRAV